MPVLRSEDGLAAHVEAAQVAGSALQRRHRQLRIEAQRSRQVQQGGANPARVVKRSDRPHRSGANPARSWSGSGFWGDPQSRTHAKTRTTHRLDRFPSMIGCSGSDLSGDPNQGMNTPCITAVVESAALGDYFRPVRKLGIHVEPTCQNIGNKTNNKHR